MPTWKDFSLSRLRAGIFYDPMRVNASQFLASFLPEHADILDKAPQIFPGIDELLPGGVPPDLPLITLVGSTGYRLQVSQVRTDVYREQTNEADPFSTEVLRDLVSFLDKLADFTDVAVNRMTAICTRYVVLPDAATTLCRKFCHERWTHNKAALNRPQHFELHAHKVFEIPGPFEVNSWIRHKAGALTGLRGDQEGILLEQDFNTAAKTPPPTYSASQRAQFFDEASRQLDEVVQLYYPEEQE
jgi:hypothetical protein